MGRRAVARRAASGKDLARTGAWDWHARRARKRRRSKSRQLVTPEEVARQSFSAPQRLLLLDTWQRSGLPARDFADLVGISKHTLYAWKQRFEQRRPGGADGPAARARKTAAGCRKSRKRTILMLKEAHPDWGCQRISDVLLARTGVCRPAPRRVARVLHEAGYEMQEPNRRARIRTKERRFERAKPNQLWQTDLFTFVLKRQNRRLYLVAFLDDHSRFIVSYGLHASSSTALVIEVLRGGIGRLRRPGRDSDRQRPAVCHLARQEPVHQATGKAGDPADRGQAPAAANAGEDRTVLGNAVAGVLSRRPCSWTWPTRGSGSACSSTTTTSSARTRGSTVWCRPTGSSARQSAAADAQARLAANAWSWRDTASPRTPSI